MTIMGACLVAIGLLVVIWGVIETHGVDMTNPDFLSFFTGGIIVVALGVCLIPALPPVGKVWGSNSLVYGVYGYGFDCQADEFCCHRWLRGVAHNEADIIDPGSRWFRPGVS